MSYVDEHLMAGESVVYRTKLHWVLFAGPAIVTAFFLLLAIPPLFSTELRGVSVLLLFLAFLTGLMLLARYVLYRSSEFAVTNKRVLMKAGVLRRRSLEILLSKIEAIGVDQSLLGRFLNYGSLTVGGTGGTKEVFDKIAAPMEFRLKVQEHTAAP